MEGDANGAPRDCTALQILLHLIIVVITATATKKKQWRKTESERRQKAHTYCRSSIQFAHCRRILEFPVKMLLQFRNCIFAFCSDYIYFFLNYFILLRYEIQSMASTAFACMHLFVFNVKKKAKKTTNEMQEEKKKKQANEKTFLWPLLLHIEQRQAEKHVCARRYINDDNGINNTFFLLHINTTCESCCCRRCRAWCCYTFYIY